MQPGSSGVVLVEPAHPPPNGPCVVAVLDSLEEPLVELGGEQEQRCLAGLGGDHLARDPDLLHFDDALFQRIPAQRPNRAPKPFSYDSGTASAWPRSLGAKVKPARRDPVRVGDAHGIGLRDDDYSTEVISICQVSDDDAPSPNRPHMEFDAPAEIPDWAAKPEDALCIFEVLGSWDSNGIRGSGPGARRPFGESLELGHRPPSGRARGPRR